MNEVRKAAVFGAGVMGAGIAAQIANAGVPVRLFDVSRAIAIGAIERLATTDPAPLMQKSNLSLITAHGIDEDMATIDDCDWIVEAIIERVDLKRALYEKIGKARKIGSVVSSNTSTIQLASLVDGMPDDLRRDFLITHFFNPPRYLRLLEIIKGPDTREDAVAAIEAFADHRLGKTPIRCKDTPGFIANRIGVYWMQCAVTRAINEGLDVETADAALGSPIGVPKTGVFALLDLVGLDLMPHVLSSMASALPKEDPLHDVIGDNRLLTDMIAAGYTGRKGKGGFYRLNPDLPGKVREARDLKSGTYRAQRKAKPDSVTRARKSGMRALFEHSDAAGRYAWWVMSRVLAYAVTLVPEISDDITGVDAAMRLGFNWKFGPFEMIDKIGAKWFADRLRAEARTVPALLQQAEGQGFYRTAAGQLQALAASGGYRTVERPPGVLLLQDIKRRSTPLAHNRSASLWDIGDGVACLEFHSKMNSLNPLILMMIDKAIRLIPGRFKGLVIYNEGSNFSVGANIGLLLIAMRLRAWFAIAALVRQGQKAFSRLKYAPFPVVAAPSGMALGGGCEVLLHSSAIQAHAETYAGLVEVGVGVVPAWGGCKEMLLRHLADRKPPRGPMRPVMKTFEMIAVASVAKSADEARDYGILRDGDGITMNRDRLLADAKAQVLALAPSYAPPPKPTLPLPGPTAKAALLMAIEGFRKTGKATAHDAVVGGQLAEVLSGGDADVTRPLSEQNVLSLEEQAFATLARSKESRARIAHMIATGKPLRN
jgi:3-hydroxyacyl-CoA dehydrogenase